MSAYGKFLEKMIAQTGEAGCWLIIILAAVIGKTIVYHYCWRPGPGTPPYVLPWWRIDEGTAEPERSTAAPGAADSARAEERTQTPRCRSGGPHVALHSRREMDASAPSDPD